MNHHPFYLLEYEAMYRPCTSLRALKAKQNEKDHNIIFLGKR
jgi:hypothetical protein